MKPAESNSTSVNPSELNTCLVLVIEDQSMVAEFLAFHCRELGLQVLPPCGTCRDGLAAVRQHRPDLLLLDISLPDGDGLELAKTVLPEMPQMKIVAISSHRDPWTMLQVQRIGLHGFVDKSDQRPVALSEAIHTVLAGRVYYPPIVGKSSASIRRDPKAFNRVLSDYEIRILSLIGESKTDEEIGAIVGSTGATVQSRRRDIMRKINVHTTPKLIHFAIVNGLTRPEQLRNQSST